MVRPAGGRRRQSGRARHGGLPGALGRAGLVGDRKTGVEQTKWFPALVGNHVADIVEKYGADTDLVPDSLTAYIAARRGAGAGGEGYNYRQHADKVSDNTYYITPEITDSFCILGEPDEHAAKLKALEKAGVSQFTIYLTNGSEERIVADYGDHVIRGSAERPLTRHSRESRNPGPSPRQRAHPAGDDRARVGRGHVDLSFPGNEDPILKPHRENGAMWIRTLLVALALAATAVSAHARELRFGYQGDAHSMDPYALNETFTLGFLGNIYEGLVRRGPDLAIEPALASVGKSSTEPVAVPLAPGRDVSWESRRLHRRRHPVLRRSRPRRGVGLETPARGRCRHRRGR